MDTRFRMDARIKWGFSASLAVLTALGGASHFILGRLLNSSDWVAHTQEVIATSESVVSSVSSAESEQRGFLLTHETEFRQQFEVLARHSLRDALRLRELVSDNPAQSANADTLKTLVSRRLEMMERALALDGLDTRDAAASMVRNEGRATMRALSSLVARFEANERALLSQRAERMRSMAGAARLAITLGSAAAALFLLGAMVIVERDLRRRIRVEASLRSSEERNLAVAKATNDAIWEWDIPSDRIVWNEGLRSLFGHDPAKAVAGRDWWETHVHPEDLAAARKTMFAETGEGTTHWTCEFRLLRADGGHAHALCRGSVLHDPQGKPARAIGAIMDITARREAEEESKRARDAAEESNRAKSEFLANMSHELRTPLNSVIGFAQVLMKDKAKKLDEKEISYLQKIHSNGKHLLSLVNSILDLSKIEAGKMEVQRESCDLLQLCGELASEFAPQAAEKGLEFRLLLPEAAASIETDRGKLKQVMINLIGNALKFTEKGSIGVRMACSGPEGKPVLLEVEDTGMGIPADRQQAVFEAFRQSDNSTSRRFGGTGLGLTISRSLLRLLGFSLELESGAGKGSRFTIRLDSAVVSLPATVDAPIVPAAESIGCQILLIDDDPDSRILLSHHLSEAGYSVAMAANGAQGLEMARAFRPQAILLDLFMSGMDGWSVLRNLKADEALCDIPVVIVSIVASESRAKTLGPVDFLDKPVDKDRLLRVLRAHTREPVGDVLIIDDDASGRELMAKALSESGVSEVRQAANGREGIAQVARRVPSLILLDLIMPEVSGLEFLEAFRSDPAHWLVPVVVVTAKDLSPEEGRQLRMQCAAVVAKGDDIGTRLNHTLAGVLGKGRAG